MPNFNNCRIGIELKNASTARCANPIFIKDCSDTGVILHNQSLFDHPGVSGSTGSSLEIFNCKRGIQIQSASRLDVENASIKQTRYGFVSLNASTFDFNKSSINGTTYTSFTGQAYGMYVSDGSIGNIFQSSVTGYAGGTASLTSGNIAVVKAGILFVGTTADQAIINTSGLGSTLIGTVYVDATLGKKTSGGDAIASVAPDE